MKIIQIPERFVQARVEGKQRICARPTVVGAEGSRPQALKLALAMAGLPVQPPFSCAKAVHPSTVRLRFSGDQTLTP